MSVIVQVNQGRVEVSGKGDEISKVYIGAGGSPVVMVKRQEMVK